MKIEILEDAELDLSNAVAFYESQSSGLGAYFIDSLMSDIESLQLFAGIHIQIEGCYRLLAHRYPYAVYYGMEEEIIYVYAVLDMRRDPSALRERLGQQYSTRS